ncbi:MAG: hypothetical protein DCC67_10705 [Planctomycetota bacterium]|nr:MAG: hypothetical protein DCC67_10705 [Planctomycetota bacterium]
MIREADAISVAAPNAPPVPLREHVADRIAAEPIEQEITRLTWAVLDGHASLADRRRLASLVDRQHALRHRDAS